MKLFNLNPTFLLLKYKYNNKLVEVRNYNLIAAGIVVGVANDMFQLLLVCKTEIQKPCASYFDSYHQINKAWWDIKLFNKNFVPGYYFNAPIKLCSIIKFNKNEIEELISKLEL